MTDPDDLLQAGAEDLTAFRRWRAGRLIRAAINLGAERALELLADMHQDALVAVELKLYPPPAPLTPMQHAIGAMVCGIAVQYVTGTPAELVALELLRDPEVIRNAFDHDAYEESKIP